MLPPSPPPPDEKAPEDDDPSDDPPGGRARGQTDDGRPLAACCRRSRRRLRPLLMLLVRGAAAAAGAPTKAQRRARPPPLLNNSGAGAKDAAAARPSRAAGAAVRARCMGRRPSIEPCAVAQAQIRRGRARAGGEGGKRRERGSFLGCFASSPPRVQLERMGGEGRAASLCLSVCLPGSLSSVCLCSCCCCVGRRARRDSGERGEGAFLNGGASLSLFLSSPPVPLRSKASYTGRALNSNGNRAHSTDPTTPRRNAARIQEIFFGGLQ